MALKIRTITARLFIHGFYKHQIKELSFTSLHNIDYKRNNKMSGDQNKLKPAAEGINLRKVVQLLDKFADLRLAEKWDNVGLLIEPTTSKLIQNIMLTNDMTELVVEEAIEKKIDLIISYHPPIFKPLKQITSYSWKERVVALCLENRIAVYSPHTAWDAVHGGVSDWLANAFNEHLYDQKEYETHPLIPNTEEEMPPNSGVGRMVYVNEISTRLCVDLIKSHTGLKDLRIAFGKNKNLDSIVNSIAVVPGSGGSALKDTNACMFVTGEMSHHDLLEANHNGTTVIITNHSNSERGFLKTMCKHLEKSLEGNAYIMVSESDADPLITV